ncbi:hypothetical protein HID58_048278 [Brassica napus]|uniref:Uncharacterized protein n=1 Tax=Brassica napus TaxID=3708 RepID=A0ABQ8B1M4_BRANA|nr:hypothetical protein HID58_048278 [Brassica napus]
MEGSPRRKSSISWKGGRSLGPIPGFLFSRDLERSFIGDPGPGSCLEVGGNDTSHAPLRQDSAPSVSLSCIPFKPELILKPDVAHLVSFLWEAVAKHVLAISRCFRRVSFLLSKEVLRHSRLWGNIARLPALVLYDEYQQAGTRRRRSFYTPPPRLARATPTTSRIRSDSVGTPTGGVRALARWELMKEWLEGRTEHWDPEEEYRQYLLWSEGLGRHSGGFSQVNLRSVAESRVSAGPPF